MANTNGNQRLQGYGPVPVRVFELARHHQVVSVPRWHRFGVDVETMRGPSGLQLLRDKNGNPVARQHGDLKPGEVSLVLR